MVDSKKNYKFDLGVKGLISLVMWTKTMATSRMKTKNSYNSKNIGNAVK